MSEFECAIGKVEYAVTNLINVNEKFLDALKGSQRYCLTDDDVREILNCETHEKRAIKLLNICKNSNGGILNLFVRALIKTDQNHVACIIDTKACKIV